MRRGLRRASVPGPVTCPDHPIQGSARTLVHVSAMPDAPSNDGSKFSGQISVVVNGGKIPNDKNETFRLFCKNYSLRDDSIPGFTGRRKPFKSDADIAYEANEYEAPTGNKIAPFCQVSIMCNPRAVACRPATEFGMISL